MSATTITSSVTEFRISTPFEEFLDWAIDAGADSDLDPITFGPWKRWAAGARTPNPAQVNAGTDFVFHSDEVFQAHAGEPLTNEILQKAALAEYKQALQMQEEHKRTERDRRAEDKRKKFEDLVEGYGGKEQQQQQRGGGKKKNAEEEEEEDPGFQM